MMLHARPNAMFVERKPAEEDVPGGLVAGSSELLRIAASVGVRQPVEGRHRPPGTSAFDRLNDAGESLTVRIIDDAQRA